MITFGWSSKTGPSDRIAKGKSISSSSSSSSRLDNHEIIITSTSDLNKCDHETSQKLNSSEMATCQTFSNPLTSSVDHRSKESSSLGHKSDEISSSGGGGGGQGGVSLVKEEVVVIPSSGEAKISFMRHQIEALFQPNYNKLAIKLFGSKRTLNQLSDTNNNNNNSQQSQSITNNSNTNQISSTINKSTDTNHRSHCIFHLCNNFSIRKCLKVKKGERGCTTIIISLILIIIILIALQSYMIIITAKQSVIVSTIKNLCLTPGCVKAASTILSRMDINVDPCHDFYSFACGSFVQMKTVPDSLVTYDMLQQMEEVSTLEMKKLLEANITETDGIAISKAKIFYTSCIDDKSNSNESETVTALIESIVHPTGPWLLLNSILNPDSKKLPFEPSLEDRILDTFIYQVQSIFRINILSEFLSNATRNDLCVSIGRTVIEDEYLVNPNCSSEYDEYKSIYKDYHVKMMERLASLLTGEEVKLRPQHLSDIDEVIDFEMEFAKLTANDYSDLSPSSSSEINFLNISMGNFDPSRSSPPSPRPLISVNDFSSNFTSIKWIKIFNQLSIISGVKISDICTEKDEYLIKLNDLIPRYSPRTIDNYLCWSILAQYTESLGPSFRRLQADFRRKVPEIRVTEPNRIFFSRWKECVYITTRILPIPSSHLYLTAKPNHVQLVNDKVTSMLNEIKEAMYTILDSQDWLNQTDEQLTNESDGLNVRLVLKNRIADSTLLVGLPDYLLNRTLLDDQYRDLIVSNEQVFINNWLNLTKHEKILELTRIGLTTEKNIYFNPPTEANAFYDWNIKMITLPLGILHEPIISEGRPRFLDYSTLGHILGHEISHSLDKDPDTDNTTGINWWPNQLKSEYESRARCFAEQYSTYKIDLINKYVNGNNTLTENICDFVGLQQAYLAWTRSTIDKLTQLPGLTNYSSDQLFFLQYGQVFCEVATPDGYLKNLLTDPHAPGKYRAHGVLVNTPQFSRAFNCPLGSPMNPVHKCKLWSIEG